CGVQFLRVCYFPSWANVRDSVAARYDIKDVDPNLCTHLVYAFGKLDRASKLLTATDGQLEESKPGHAGRYREFNDLKKVNIKLRTLLSVGGQNDPGEGFETITENTDILARFSTSAVEFLRTRGFDGLDIDWEYPTKSTRSRLVLLLQALRKAFDEEKTKEKLILSLAGAAGQWQIDESYDVPSIARYVDYVSLMTYDYTVRTSVVTAFNSPLFSRNSIQFNPTLSVNWTVHYWRDKGLPFSKILVGITGVGRRLVLSYPNVTSVGSPVTGEIRQGDYYRLEAALAYPEICTLLSNPLTRRVFDTEQQSPYLFKGDDWVGYEDPESIALKIKWMMGLGLAGVMFWSLDQDDFSGKMCGGGRYPLLNAIRKSLGIEPVPPTTQRPNERTTSAGSSPTHEVQHYPHVHLMWLCLLRLLLSLV
ncbi:unnamed protein product, partial [Candidula unifasciata]